jgi:hypothetical protein
MGIRVLKQALLLLWLVAVARSAAHQAYTFPTNGRFVLPTPSARAIFHQCSRAAPPANSELWQPSGKDLDELEASLAKYLNEREKAGKTVPPRSVTYHRQYVGFTRNGERLVYGNFYPASAELLRHESSEPVQVCDGGHVFWGIVYRVTTKTFEELQFNGFA